MSLRNLESIVFCIRKTPVGYTTYTCNNNIVLVYILKYYSDKQATFICNTLIETMKLNNQWVKSFAKILHVICG